MTEAERGSPLVLATYNVHGCVGRDGRRDPERVATVIGELQADVIALQEVAAHSEPGPAEDQFHLLAERTGLFALPGPTLDHPRGRYGNALLTRLPVADVALIDLSVPGREPRGALDVRLETPAGTVRVLATHLGLRAGERLQQVERLLSHIGAGPEPVLLLGDLNEWRPRAALLRLLRRRLGPVRAVRSFPAARPLLALDRIFARPAHALTQVSAHVSPTSRQASDHLPVRAELVLPA
jgi:endonuclease/exonuclease/phosphatase family metal-dependent hydrolase